mmetsp:Transcript_8464/g.10606  ORF Transcript_8464/g.10606 Transcript_8464/m.10606 type:complete len:335 (-) Transcript_8464:36-1040(-)
MFRITNQVYRNAIDRVAQATPHFGNRTRSKAFSSRIRRRRPASARLSNNIENDDVEKKKKKTEFQVKDMLESTSSGVFIPTNKNGEEVTMGEYLEFANLSPWVPCPDAVAKRALDIANAGSEDVHYELGSGDGRVNFCAIDVYEVKKSIGIDIDSSMVNKSSERIFKRHPAPENVSFVCADLVDEASRKTADIWKNIEEECTILTMYFVDDALDQLKPLLEKHLLGKNCKVLTIGYQMNGWEPKWSELILGLSINMYDMNNLDELYNRTFEPDDEISFEDVELNAKSRQILAEQGKSEPNPFADQKKITELQLQEDLSHLDMDFDENEEIDLEK